MEMNVLINSCTCGSAQICPEVKSLRLGDFFKRVNTFSCHHHNLTMLFAGKFCKAGCVQVWYDHQMPTVIRISVHDNKTELSPPYNEIFHICFFSVFFSYPAKKASARMLFFAKSFDICRTPGGKKMFHCIASK